MSKTRNTLLFGQRIELTLETSPLNGSKSDMMSRLPRAAERNRRGTNGSQGQERVPKIKIIFGAKDKNNNYVKVSRRSGLKFDVMPRLSMTADHNRRGTRRSRRQKCAFRVKTIPASFRPAPLNMDGTSGTKNHAPPSISQVTNSMSSPKTCAIRSE